MPLHLALLGDSIAYGTGAARTADTLAPRLVQALAADGIDAVARVLAVPGSTSAALSAQVRQAVAGPADVAVVVIGANDLTRLRPADTAAGELRSAVRALRAHGVEVVVAPAPDLSIVPGVPPAARELVRLGSDRLRQAQTAATLAEGGRVADRDSATSSAFRSDRTLFAGDRFHPSSAGYAVIAAALTAPVRAAARDALGAADGEARAS